MTEPQFQSSETPGNEQSERPRRGRPRAQETLARDEAVAEALRYGSKTREQLADELSIGPNLVYLSLWRLRRDRRVEKTADGDVRHAWRLTS